MNDIEIIKQVIYTEQGEKMNYIDIDNVIDDDCEIFIQAIENLIQRNKDLEQIEKEHKKENGRLRDRIKKLEENLQMQKTKIDILTGKMIVEINNNAKEVKIKTEKLYIPRYKIQGKIKELENKKAKLKIKKTIDRYVNHIEALKNLLEEF